jgi:hypothetical protein
MEDKYKYIVHNRGVQGRRRPWIIVVGFPILCAIFLEVAIFYILLVLYEAAGEVLTPLPPLCAHEDIVCEGEQMPIIKQVRYVEAYITHYTNADCTNSKCLTASGDITKKNGAACPRNLPLGQKILIGGERYMCNDRYATWLDSVRDLPTFDIWTDETTEEALAFGKQKMIVGIIHNP